MSRTVAIRIAAAVLAAIIVAFSVFTYLSYSAAFTRTDTVTVNSSQAGLVMDKDAKVKYRGIQIGKVEDIAYSGDQAKLRTLPPVTIGPLTLRLTEPSGETVKRSSSPANVAFAM